MELQFQTVTILLMLITCLWSIVESQSLLNVSEIEPARVLDAVIQDYAFRAFVTPKTGVTFDAIVPRNLTGIQISALRLRSGSLFTRGVPMYKEFRIPIGIIEKPYVERLVLVYQNLGNWSNMYYSLPEYIFLAPVLGLLAYNGSDLSTKNQTELKIEASREPIIIDYGSVRPAPDGSNPMCLQVDLHGQVNLTNTVSGNRCLAFKQGHFSIVVKSTSKSNSTPPSSAPSSPQLLPPATSEVVKPDKNGGTDSSGWVYVIYAIGGCVLLVLLAVLVLWIREYKRRRMTHKMELAAEGGEPLHMMTMIGGMKAPAAMVTRTQPTLETEYVP